MIDLRKCSYDEWLDFVFEHDVGEMPNVWYFEKGWRYSIDPDLAITYLMQLFSNPAILNSRFSVSQIDQGFWFISSSNGFIRFLLCEAVSIEKRVDCIRAINILFDKLFCCLDVGTSSYMWWDSFFSYAVYEEHQIQSDPPLLQAVVQVLEEMLKIDCRKANDSALHGIDHLAKMDVGASKPLVTRFLESINK